MGFMSSFFDLGDKWADAVFSEDPAAACPGGQVPAREVLAGGGNGVRYPSARYAGGKRVTALRPHLVQNLQRGPTWAVTWAGSLERDASGVGAS